MPQDTRALARAARARARARGERYTEARAAILAIRERMDEADETFEDAEAWYDDPRNQLLCATCGWTLGMICPECAPGCGCSTGCSGWRHREFSSDDDDDDGGWECECGADHEYNCVC
jgi:hypothetical protein